MLTFVPFGKEQKRGLDKEVFGNFFDGYFQVCTNLHIPADTRSAFPVISVQSPVSIQCCWQS